MLLLSQFNEFCRIKKKLFGILGQVRRIVYLIPVALFLTKQLTTVCTRINEYVLTGCY